jgi:hypothetical protein
MTLFNVRLGAWLGNPKSGKWTTDGPKIAFWPLIREATIRTDLKSSCVYLSDGGHFENLGLYAAIERRCGLIILSDAGCDPKMQFDDLGNALRKIAIDMGVQIRFDPGEPCMKPRSPGGQAPSPGQPPPASYWAKADIFYPEATQLPGTLIYIKPAFYGTEPPDIRNYAGTHPEFPHETTLDQWFTESQFESYRHLGAFVIATMKTKADASWNAILGMN